MIEQWRLASILTVMQNYEALAETRAPVAPELESAFAELLALRTEVALCNEALAACQSQAAGRIRVLESALVHAVDCVRVWHNMGVPVLQCSELWDIYWRNAPEMKPIREALKEAK